MAYLNDNYLKLQAGYLFPEIARRVHEYCEANPDAAKRLIRCGIGDAETVYSKPSPLLSRPRRTQIWTSMLF